MSTVPASSNVLVITIMLAFFSLCMVITFQAPLEWWLLPLALTTVIAVIATVRVRRHRRMRRAMQGAPR